VWAKLNVVSRGVRLVCIDRQLWHENAMLGIMIMRLDRSSAHLLE
jgi:hypothetical protein